jgi:hypothetical protein
LGLFAALPDDPIIVSYYRVASREQPSSVQASLNKAASCLLKRTLLSIPNLQEITPGVILALLISWSTEGNWGGIISTFQGWQVNKCG